MCSHFWVRTQRWQLIYNLLQSLDIGSKDLARMTGRFVDQDPITRFCFFDRKFSLVILEKSTAWSSLTSLNVPLLDVALADVCRCAEICARALLQYELNISSLSRNWTAVSQVLTSSTSDLNSFVMGLNESATCTECGSSITVATPAQRAVSITWQRTEAQLQRSLYVCVGQGPQGEPATLCWCAQGADHSLGGRTLLRSVWRYAEFMHCMLKHDAKGSLYVSVCFTLQGNLYGLEETETVEVKYSGWGFNCVDPFKVNGSCTTKSLHVTPNSQ